MFSVTFDAYETTQQPISQLVLAVAVLKGHVVFMVSKINVTLFDVTMQK